MNETTAAAIAALTLASLPAIGQPLEGGLFAGLTTTKDGKHCAVVLLDDKPDDQLSWKAAMAWAAEREAQLPSRPVSALLFANLREQFERDWYWTGEQHEADGAFAWCQTFSYGGQYSYHASTVGRVRAVRLIPIGV